MNPIFHVLIADLTHSPVITSTDGMPLVPALLAGAIEKDLGNAVTTCIHRFINPLLEDIRVSSVAPPALLLSNYIWNHELARHVARIFKQRHPDRLVVMGGPNWPLDRECQEKLMRSMPEVDLYVVGEGERVIADVLRQYLDSNLDVETLKNRCLPGCARILPDKSFLGEAPPPRISVLDELPSPWLSGRLDRFFLPELQPVIQTNRGCPFTCTFCNSGVNYYTKVHHYSIERIREELIYIARKIKSCCPSTFRLNISDDNFGMYDRDLEICEVIAELQRDFNYPRQISCTTGKNRPDRIIAAIERLGKSIDFSSSPQSLNPETLSLIKRDNIRLDTYTRIQEKNTEKGLPTMAFVMSCLPGETLQSYIDGIAAVIDSGVSRLCTYQTIMASGSEIEMKSAREQYQFRTKIRLSPGGLSEVEGRYVAEWEEVVVGTATMPEEDALRARIFDFCVYLFANDRPFIAFEKYLQSLQFPRSSLLRQLFAQLDEASGPLRALFDDFARDAQEEFFTSQDELNRHYGRREIVARVKSGEAGISLLRRAQALALARTFFDVVSFVQSACEKLAGHEHSIALRDIADYCRAVPVFSENLFELKTFHEVKLNHDVAAWMADSSGRALDEYLLSNPKTFTFRLSLDHEQVIRQALSTYGNSIPELVKIFTFVPFTAFMRDVEQPLA